MRLLERAKRLCAGLGLAAGACPAVALEIKFVDSEADCQVFATTEDSGGRELGRHWIGISSPLNADAWIDGRMGVGFGNDGGDPYDPWLRTDVRGLMYDAGGSTGTGSLYVRIPFQIQDTAGLAELRSLTLRMRFDDGFIAYLNGTEIARFNAPGELHSESTAVNPRLDSVAVREHPFCVSEHLEDLVVGENLLAIHVLNAARVNGDLLVSAELVASDSESILPPSAGVVAIVGTTYNRISKKLSRLDVRIVPGRIYEVQESMDLVTWANAGQNSTLYLFPGEAEAIVTARLNTDALYLRVLER